MTDTDDELIADDLENSDLALFSVEPENSGTESESDIAEIKDMDFRNVVLAPSDWTVQTIISQLGSKSFDLNPDFQRRNAWTDSRKSKFIESLILGLPIPQITFAEHEIDDDGFTRYIVIDGKQRLLALESFYSEHSPLQLNGLTVLPQLNGLTRADILSDAAISRYANRLTNRTIRTVVIKQWPSKEFLHLVFHRINHQTLPLSAQELRQALSPGPFTRFADDFAGRSRELHRILGVSQMPDFRMRDVELLVRFLAFRFNIEAYRGNLKKFLDETCDELNRNWRTTESAVLDESRKCNEAIRATEEIFGDHAFHRVAETGQWETRFNRTVFDIMLYYFSDPRIVDLALVDKDAVVSAFYELNTSDRIFSLALTTTTKTVGATSRRLSAWGDRLSEVLNVSLKVPRLTEGGRRIEIDDVD
ncbi:DUF262 domain-containing protein [Actinokineospora sp. NBRC 105648]|uniref:DUF262 domain-containing protein n=1 Tax=Actinokineospora sp. NBRC 105648 TaxID=3032206 RepID=UPI0024A0355F|nr:DUF262 domain-containing protein [Actinokineospora sp. NBRC 105648]GLZ38370.1 hypothetical protein Acsp05_19940 [Actinokineospora sp. NBRC 105648]